jgi:phosphatidylglycerophosphatase A
MVLGTIAAHKAEIELGRHDDQHIVIDEFVGCLIACAFLPRTFLYIMGGFILFRIFDIYKPPPIRQIQNVKGGLGIMLDDVLAGIAANLLLQGIHYLLIRLA